MSHGILERGLVREPTIILFGTTEAGCTQTGSLWCAVRRTRTIVQASEVWNSHNHTLRAASAATKPVCSAPIATPDVRSNYTAVQTDGAAHLGDHEAQRSFLAPIG